MAAPGGVEVDEEEVGGAHSRLEVAAIQLQHAPVPRDLELCRLPFAIAAGYAALWPQKEEEEDDGKQQPPQRHSDAPLRLIRSRHGCARGSDCLPF